MDQFRDSVAAEGERLLQELPAQVARVHALVQQRCPERRPSALRAQFAARVLAAPTAIAANAEVSALLDATADELELAQATLRKLQLWLSLLVPKVSDGNNFGVEVQKAAFTQLKEAAAALQKAFDALCEYPQQRAAAVDKLSAKRSRESSTSTTRTTTAAAAPGAESEDKTVTTVTDKAGEALAAEPGEDALAHVVAIDVHWFCALARHLEAVRDQYAVAADMLRKNKDKVLQPRGSGDRAGFNMF